jgi:hypothetical protein
MEIINIKSVVCLFLCGAMSGLSLLNAQTVTVNPAEISGPLTNPLMGFRPDPDMYNNYPYPTLVRHYISWKSIEDAEADTVQKIKDFCDAEWAEYPAANVKVIPRIFIDWDYKDGDEYWPADLTTGDWSSQEFKDRVVRLIGRLGEVWDNDPRVAWVQMGIIGYWGEQESPVGAHQDGWSQRLGDAFTAAFKNKKFLVRNMGAFSDYQVGTYWDSFAHPSQSNVNSSIKSYNAQGRYLTQPIEGEVAYNWGDTSKFGTSPNQTLSDPAKRKYMIDTIRDLHCSALGWIASYSTTDAQAVAGAAEVQKAFGYRFKLTEFSCSARTEPGSNMNVSFKVKNIGSAPFYENWPVAVVLIDPATRQIVWQAILPGTDTSKWAPGGNYDTTSEAYTTPATEHQITASVSVPSALATGEYLVGVSILEWTSRTPGVFFAVPNFFKESQSQPLCRIGIGVDASSHSLTGVAFDDLVTDDARYYTLDPFPIVTVSATDTSAGEPSNNGTFTFTRTGDTSAAMTVHFTVGGGATSGSDYQSLGASVTIAAGLTSATKTVAVIDDTIVESSETVIVTLASGMDYNSLFFNTATVTIADNEFGFVSLLQDSGLDGLLVFEVETAFATQIDAGGKSWTPVTTPSGYSGSGALQALPNTGTLVSLTDLANSPRLDYPVNFTKTGTHYIWLRGVGPSTSDNSVIVGLDGSAASDGNQVATITGDAYGWANQDNDGAVRTINVERVGLSTLNVWMREDGIVVDKLLITANSAYTPSGNGPAESPTANTVALPSPWQTEDIGAVEAVGSASYSSPTWTLTGSGAGINSTDDEFRYVYQNFSGDCSVVARVESLTATDAWAKAGVMIRESTAANSPNIMVCVTAGNGVSLQYRATAGGATTSSFTVAGQTAPKWLKIKRIGSLFTAYRSDDGTIWTQVGTAQTITMVTAATLGLAVTSRTDGTLCTSTLDNVTVSDIPPSAALPIPWQTEDIGAVEAVGSASYSSPNWTLTGSGWDIHGTADEFRYVYQNSSGDCSVVARVGSLTITDAWAKAGVMIRESTAANSPNIMVCLTASNGVSLQYRSKAGGGTTNSITLTGHTAPQWLRINRTANSFAAYRSDDGSSWTPVGTAQAINMATNVTLGLAVTSHNDGTLCTSTQDNVTATVNVSSNFNAWLLGYGLTGSNALDTADPEGDGVVNLKEYALGLNPTLANVNPLKLDQVSLGGNTYLRLSVNRDSTVTNVLIEGLSARTLSDPTAWSSDTVVIEENTDSVFTVRGSVPIETGGDSSFLKFRFTLQ